jgi:hypothetical protein
MAPSCHPAKLWYSQAPAGKKYGELNQVDNPIACICDGEPAGELDAGKKYMSI